MNTSQNNGNYGFLYICILIYRAETKQLIVLVKTVIKKHNKINQKYLTTILLHRRLGYTLLLLNIPTSEFCQSDRIPRTLDIFRRVYI